jgi:tryptophan halogenase
MPSTRRKAEPPETVLRSFAEGLGLPVMGESSVKLVPGAAQADRYLLSVPATGINPQQAAELVHVAVSLGLEPDMADRVAADLPLSTTMHFGFEREGERTTLKLYCEFPLGRGWDVARRGNHPMLVHRAVKWDPRDATRAAVSRYVAQPALTVAATGARIRDLLGQGAPADLALALFNRAAGRVPAEDRLFLEVEEEGSARRSFDLKLYDARFTTADLGPALPGLIAFFGLDGFRVPAAALGHIAGGRGRDGKPFLTLYYGGGRA